MRLLTILTIALLAAGSAAAQSGGATSISLFGSGLARRERAGIRGWEGGAGIAIERNVRGPLSLELSVERRIDRQAQTAGGRLCGPFHNTCFDTHLLETTSTPIVLLARYRYPSRLAPFASFGIRYVPKPSVQDLTPVHFVPGSFFGTDVDRHASAEVGAGLEWKAGAHLSLFAEERSLVRRHGSAWDPLRRWNAGLRMQF
ncbi:MAG TPA: hypothetical protein VN605_09385 [Thermoanaerobaculia bacterium]|nr:hypothetical protein [Thermoanaerobaculia bacterium]